MSRAHAFEESAVLEMGARGKFRGKGFVLAGRTCLKSKGGGLWNEWNMRFDDGSSAALSEARGIFVVYQERALAPAHGAVSVGKPLDTGFVVVERGEADRVATFGEVDHLPRTYRYVDLSSNERELATIDWTDPAQPRTYVGASVTLADLGLAPRKARPRFVPAPDVVRPKGVELYLQVGDEGELYPSGYHEARHAGSGKARFRVIGIVGRSLRADGERFTWEEYLLHEPAHGFRWLVVADGHWNLVEIIEPGMVIEDERGATYEGEHYRSFSSGKARVDWAAGELPWQAAVGDTASVADYVRAPYMLSRESTPDEITWSRATYLPTDAVARAFGKRLLPKPVGRAPNQPSSKKQSSAKR